MDDGYLDNLDEEHDFTNNTLYYGQLHIYRQDSINVSYNLFISAPTNIAVDEEYDGESESNTISNNRLDNTSTLTNLNDAYTATGNDTCTSNFNATTGAHDCTQATYGADLKIDVWPFTDQASNALQDDYPYAGIAVTVPTAKGCTFSGVVFK